MDWKLVVAILLFAVCGVVCGVPVTGCGNNAVWGQRTGRDPQHTFFFPPSASQPRALINNKPGLHFSVNVTVPDYRLVPYTIVGCDGITYTFESRRVIVIDPDTKDVKTVEILSKFDENWSIYSISIYCNTVKNTLTATIFKGSFSHPGEFGVLGYDLMSGQVFWHSTTLRGLWEDTTDSSGLVILSSTSQKAVTLVAFEPPSAPSTYPVAPKWTATRSGNNKLFALKVLPSPNVGGLLYLSYSSNEADKDTIIEGINAQTSVSTWQNSFPTNTFLISVRSDDVLVLGQADETQVLLASGSSGDLVSTFNQVYPIAQAPKNSLICQLVDGTGSHVRLDGNGKPIWKWSFNDKINLNIIVDGDGMVYATGFDTNSNMGLIIGLDLETGEQKWRFDGPFDLLNMLVSTDQGGYYILNTDKKGLRFIS